jgi:peptide/nickel transport system ATP-binding protein
VEEGPTEDVLRRPAHPYTRGLLNALPRPSLRGRPLENIPGTVPGLLEPPRGCRFHPRCPHVMDLCMQEKPRMVAVGTGHTALCVLHYPEVRHG